MARELMFMQIYAIIHINAAVLLIYFFSFNIPPTRRGRGGRRARLGLAWIHVKQRSWIWLTKCFVLRRASRESLGLAIQQISYAIDGPGGTRTRQKINCFSRQKALFSNASYLFYFFKAHSTRRSVIRAQDGTRFYF